jgi:hypothetical protein
MIGTAATQSQVIDIPPSLLDAVGKMLEAHDENQNVKEITAQIEELYQVECNGKSSTVFPDFSKKANFKAKCYGSGISLELEIKSKFKTYKSEDYQFKLKEYTVKF